MLLFRSAQSTSCERGDRSKPPRTRDSPLRPDGRQNGRQKSARGFFAKRRKIVRDALYALLVAAAANITTPRAIRLSARISNHTIARGLACRFPALNKFVRLQSARNQ